MEQWTPLNTKDRAPLSYQRNEQSGFKGPVYIDYLADERGVFIPKDPVENLEWRTSVYEETSVDDHARNNLIHQLSRSPVLYFNLLAFTETQFRYLGDGTTIEEEHKHRPFVTFPGQDREILRIHRCRSQSRNILGVKTREMGWTWIVMTYFAWALLFNKDCHMLAISRKEGEVDSKGKPDSLFAKVRYNLQKKYLPVWLHDDCNAILKDDKELQIVNPSMGSAINGEATVEGAGRSGRKAIALVDEAREIRYLQSMCDALAETTSLLIVISTPRAGSQFNRLFSGPGFEHAKMPWQEDPRKARDMRSDTDTRSGFTSPWYEWKRVNHTPRFMAEEIDCELSSSGVRVFSDQTLSAAKGMVEPPKHTGRILFAQVFNESGFVGRTDQPDMLSESDARLRDKDRTAIQFESDKGGSLMLWCDLKEDENGILRPPQDTAYLFGADPGEGRRQANGVIDIMDARTGEEVGIFASPIYGPRDLGRIAVALMLWFGGEGGMAYPEIDYESNGPGGNFGDVVVNVLGWPRVRQRVPFDRNDDGKTKSTVPGWCNTEAELRVLLNRCGDRMTAGKSRPRCAKTVDDMHEWIVSEDGKYVCALVADQTTAAQAAHGDRAIAFALNAARMGLVQIKYNKEEADRRRAAKDPRTMHGRETLAREEARRERSRYTVRPVTSTVRVI